MLNFQGVVLSFFPSGIILNKHLIMKLDTVWPKGSKLQLEISVVVSHSTQREKLGTLQRVPEISVPMYTGIPPIYGLYNDCIGQYGVIFGEQLQGYPPKGTQHFPLIHLQNFGPIFLSNIHARPRRKASLALERLLGSRLGWSEDISTRDGSESFKSSGNTWTFLKRHRLIDW